jgi:hypothetical protein
MCHGYETTWWKSKTAVKVKETARQDDKVKSATEEKVIECSGLVRAWFRLSASNIFDAGFRMGDTDPCACLIELNALWMELKTIYVQDQSADATA